MEKEQMIMDFLYSRYGGFLENHGYKPNKSKNKYTIKTKNSLSEVNFLFSKRSKVLHLTYLYTNLKVEKLHIDMENRIRMEEGLDVHKFPRPSFAITDWKNIFTLYGYKYENLGGWITAIESIDLLEEKTKNTYTKALEIIVNLTEKFKTLDDILDILWKNNNLSTHMNTYDATNILIINKLKSEADLLKSYQEIISCSQYQNLPDIPKQEVIECFNILKNMELSL